MYAIRSYYEQKKAIWSKQSYKTEREAKREEARMLRDLEENIRLSSKVTFLEVAKSWTDSSAENYANSTFQGYQWYLSRYLLPVFEDKYMDEIEPKHLQTYVNELSKQYSAETVNKNINILSNIFQHAVTLQLVRSNLMEGIKRKKVVITSYSIHYTKLYETGYIVNATFSSFMAVRTSGAWASRAAGRSRTPGTCS